MAHLHKIRSFKKVVKFTYTTKLWSDANLARERSNSSTGMWGVATFEGVKRTEASVGIQTPNIFEEAKGPKKG